MLRSINIGWLIISTASVMGQALPANLFYSDHTTMLEINHFAIDTTIFSGGVHIFDFDNDGWQDIYFTGGERRDKLYRNLGQGVFQDISHLAGLESTAEVITYGVGSADLDKDGYKDLIITTKNEFSTLVLKNQGDGSFIDMTTGSGLDDNLYWGTSLSFGDVNLDGWVDVYIGNFAITNSENVRVESALEGGYPNSLYLNEGNMHFVNATEKYGVADPNGCTLAVAFSDVDNDSIPDIIVGNDFGYLFEPNKLFINAHPLPFFNDESEIRKADQGIASMGYAVGDIDHDGDLDYYLSNFWDNILYRNDGVDFQNIGKAFHVDLPEQVSWGTAFLDFNYDGVLDLVVANGDVRYEETAHKNALFLGTTDRGFVDVSDHMKFDNPDRHRGLAIGDLDNDGDLDIICAAVSTNKGNEVKAKVYFNSLNDFRRTNANFLLLSLEGVQTNTDGFGAHVTLYSEGEHWLREMDGGSSYLSHHQALIHFGLGTREMIDSIIVSWVGGSTDTYRDVSVNSHLLLQEGGGIFELPLSGNLISQVNESQSKYTLEAFPNPTEGYFIIHTQEGIRLATPQLFSAQGSEMELHAERVSNNRFKCEPVPHLKSGVYIIKCRIGNAEHQSKLLIIK